MANPKFVQRCSKPSLDGTNCPARGMPGVGNSEQRRLCGDYLRSLNTYEAQEKLRQHDFTYAQSHPKD